MLEVEKWKQTGFCVMTVVHVCLLARSRGNKLPVLHMCLFLQVPACFCSQYSRLVFLCVPYRIIHGVGKPDEVLECIDRGVDIFESFFPFQVTERGCALVFSYDYHSDPEAAGRLFDGHYNFFLYQLVLWQA